MSKDGIREIGKDKNGKTVWELNVSYTDSYTGEAKRMFRRFHGTYRQAQKQRAQLIAETENGVRAIEADKITFREYADSWFEGWKATGEWSNSSMKDKATIVEMLKERFGGSKLKDIKPTHISGYYSGLKSSGISGARIRKYHNTINQIMRSAVNDDVLARNPVERVKAPSAGKPNRKALSKADVAKLLEKVNDAFEAGVTAYIEKEERRIKRGDNEERKTVADVSPLSCLVGVRIAISTGARRGEILALTWERIDLNGGTLRICEGIDVTTGKPKSTKTDSSVRTISIDDDLVRFLERWQKFQSMHLENIGARIEATTPVLCNSLGGYVKASNFGEDWRRFRKESGFSDLKFHELRHSHFTLLLANGVDLKTAQGRGGWSNANVLLNSYAHCVPENDKAAANLFGGLISAPNKKDGGNVIKISAAS